MRRQSKKGSALVATTIVLLILVGIVAALFTEVLFRQKYTFASYAKDESTLVAEAGLERARRALYLWRLNNSWDPTIPPNASTDNAGQWNDILAFCQSSNPDCTSTSADTRRYFPPAGADLASFLAGVQANRDIVVGQNPATPVNLLWQSYYTNKESNDAWITFNLSNPSQNADAPPKSESSAPPYRIFLGQCQPFAKGMYHVTVRDNDDGDGNLLSDSDRTIICTVTSLLHDGSMRQVEALLTYTPAQWAPAQAILTQGSMKLNGNPQVLGSSGGIHANGNLVLSGNPTISKNATATGTYTVSGTPTIGGTAGGGQPAIEVPLIQPTLYSSKADYFLKADGTVTDALGVVIDSDGNWNQWTFGGGTWDLSGNTAPMAKTYYFYTPVKISGNPIATMTLISEGSISVSGNPGLTPVLDDVAMVSGRDIKISGNPDITYNGFYAAWEQIEVSGNPNLVGALAAQDMEDVSKTVKRTGQGEAAQISGNASITYNGGLRTQIMLSSKVSIVNLRRTFPK